MPVQTLKRNVNGRRLRGRETSNSPYLLGSSVGSSWPATATCGPSADFLRTNQDRFLRMIGQRGGSKETTGHVDQRGGRCCSVGADLPASCGCPTVVRSNRTRRE